MNPNEVINAGTHMMVNNIDEQNMLLDHLTKDMLVLEFGFGFSTLLIARRVAQVISVEHDEEAYNTFKARQPENVTILFRRQNHPITEPGGDGTLEQFKDYVEAPMMYHRKYFDVVFIDGRARVACAEYAEKYYLKEGGRIFIHDYRHPQPPPYRRLEYEVVERFLKMEKHVFAMAMFSVIPEDVRKHLTPLPIVDQLFERHTGKHLISPLSPIEQAREEFENTMIDEVTEQQIRYLKAEENPPADINTTATAVLEKPGNSLEPAEMPVCISIPEPQSNDSSIRWSKGSVDGMNSFYDTHIKDHEITKHMEPFTRLLNCIDAENDHRLLDIGCGTAMLSGWTPGFEYYGADLPHIIAGCSIRNKPNHFYRGCDLVGDDISWMKTFDVITASGVIDIMEHPMYVLDKILKNTKKYLLIHRQEISEQRPTHADPNGPGYDTTAWHSVINRKDLDDLLAFHKFRKIEVPCTFANWENGGSSFLLIKEK